MIFLCLIQTATLSADPVRENVILVLDASGSMWGQIEGTPKIAIAKEVISEMLQGWDTGVHLGLTVYGHRRKGDCNDIESLIPLGKLEADEFVDKLHKINPKGKTPLSEAVSHAAKELRYSEQKATVILVSDGLEICERNPCELGKSLEEAGVDFTAHVVGFDLKEEERAQLECLAANTGGRYFSASDAKSLTAAISEAVEQSVSPSGVRLKAVNVAGGEALKDVSWEIFELEEDSLGNRTKIAYSYTDRPVFHLSAGRYLVAATRGASSAQSEIEVLKDVTSEEELVMGAGDILAEAVLNVGDKPLEKVSWKVWGQANGLGERQQVAFSYAGQPTFSLSAGSYRLEASVDAAVVGRDIEVKGGDRRREVIVLGSGVIAAMAISHEGAAPYTEVSWKIYTTDPEMGERKQVAYSHSAQPKFTLPAGAYSLEATVGAAVVVKSIEVQAGSASQEILTMRAGTIKLSAVPSEGGQPYQGVSWKVFRVDGESDERGDQITFSYSAVPAFTLVSGTYEFEATVGDSIVSERIVVGEGTIAPHAVVMGTGTIQVDAKLTREGAAPDRVTWKVFAYLDGEKRGNQVGYSYSNSPTFTLPAGAYELEATADATVVASKITIESGENKRETVDLHAGVVKVSASLSASGLVLQNAKWKVFRYADGAKGTQISYSFSSQPTFTLPAGKYLLEATVDATVKTQEVEVQPGLQSAIVVSLDAGQVKLTALSAPGSAPLTGAKWEIFLAGEDELGNRKQFTYSYSANPIMTLPAGRYVARATVGQRVGSLDFEVISGSQGQVEVVLE